MADDSLPSASTTARAPITVDMVSRAVRSEFGGETRLQREHRAVVSELAAGLQLEPEEWERRKRRLTGEEYRQELMAAVLDKSDPDPDPRCPVCAGQLRLAEPGLPDEGSWLCCGARPWEPRCRQPRAERWKCSTLDCRFEGLCAEHHAAKKAELIQEERARFWRKSIARRDIPALVSEGAAAEALRLRDSLSRPALFSIWLADYRARQPLQGEHGSNWSPPRQDPGGRGLPPLGAPQHPHVTPPQPGLPGGAQAAQPASTPPLPLQGPPPDVQGVQGLRAAAAAAAAQAPVSALSGPPVPDEVNAAVAAAMSAAAARCGAALPPAHQPHSPLPQQPYGAPPAQPYGAPPPPRPYGVAAEPGAPYVIHQERPYGAPPPDGEPWAPRGAAYPGVPWERAGGDGVLALGPAGAL
eukprot:TRINITY_DN11672_c0_g1_i2.p1 TRINITY_DN11672_c0_g1~~TRINITY_DN11672_c0_g1_i2.p1  ORF type:complete len:443 (+),score=106.85 TRINITY_DN11672_c0_g1_i2:94-1329(+)